VNYLKNKIFVIRKIIFKSLLNNLTRLDMRKSNKTSILMLLVVFFSLNTGLLAQDHKVAPKLFIGGGALPDEMYIEFIKLIGPEARLVVIPTAGSEEPDKAEIRERWKSRGVKEVSVVHTRKPEEASAPGFADPIKKATAIWISGGSQHRIADAYLNTPVEDEVYKLLERGGVIGGSSAGAAVLSRTMIRGGDSIPRISTGFDLFHEAVIDQHFLKRNRFSRLIEAVRLNPGLTGYGIDEGTAIIVSGDHLTFAGKSYVLRVRQLDGRINIDAFEAGDTISMSGR
jgi:cyanophycinase